MLTVKKKCITEESVPFTESPEVSPNLFQLRDAVLSEPTTNTATTATNVNSEEVRALRLNHFVRNVQLPLRYRHSIGSPSLNISSTIKCK